MENEFRVIDLILAVILIIVMCVGIGMCFVNAPTMSGKLTTENYQEYLDIRTGLNTVLGGTEFSMVFVPRMRYEVTDVSMTIHLTGRSIDSQTVDISFSASNNEPYLYEIILNSRQPTYYEAISGDWFKINYDIISISGQFNKGKLK